MVKKAIVTLNKTTINSLKEALHEEYLALDTYKAIQSNLSAQHLDTTIFDKIIKSEQQHINTLLKTANTYHVNIADAQRDIIDLNTIPNNQKDAYALGMSLELADGDLYNQLIIDSTNSNVDKVYGNLQKASYENHYVAFSNAFESVNLVGVNHSEVY